MIQYLSIPPFNKQPLHEVTDEEINKYQEEIDKIKEQNQIIYKDLVEKAKESLSLIKQVWGENSSQVKYFKKQSIPSPPNYFGYSIKDRVEKARKEEDIRQKVIEAKEKESRLTERAVKWLQARNRVLGEDFYLENAISAANDIAFDEEKERLENSGETFKCYCNECEEWDGVSHRCVCGNRRIYWTQDYGFSFENPSLTAEVD